MCTAIEFEKDFDMKDVIWNAVSFVAVVALALAYETGAVAAGNAFFGLFAVLVLYTAKQLLTHENELLSEAFKGLFAPSVTWHDGKLRFLYWYDGAGFSRYGADGFGFLREAH